MNVLATPQLVKRSFGGIPVLTDDELFRQTRVRIAFTGREGGVSSGPFESLNLGSHVNDSLDDVLENRRLLLSAMGGEGCSLLVPNQVHGVHVCKVSDACDRAVSRAKEEIAQGADGIAVECDSVAALLCYADCTPVIIVAPSGRFCVVHAGWRGAVGGIVGNAIRLLCDEGREDASQLNMYIGPHIRQECFETGEDVTDRFVARYGNTCASDSRHVSLAQAVTQDALDAGVDPRRIVDAGICTRCNSEAYYSYRASKGVCGRHGAFAVRL